MSDYLKNLVARTLDPSRVVQPRFASRFEPHAAAPGAVTAFDVEMETEVSPAMPPAARAETRRTSVTTPAETRRTSVTPPAESAPHAQAEHAPPVFERRPELSSHEQSPAPTSERAPNPPPSQTFTNKVAPELPAANVEVWKSSARAESSESNPEARRAAQPSPESAERQTSRSGPHVVEPRLSLTPKVFEAQQPQDSNATELAHDDAAPTIRVTIGRVDVRAVASGPKEARRAPAQPRPALTLEDYLRRRGGGSR